jgi:hypothetical protein
MLRGATLTGFNPADQQRELMKQWQQRRRLADRIRR